MRSALFIVLDKEVDFDDFVNGKFLSRTSDALDKLATQLGVRLLQTSEAAEDMECVDKGGVRGGKRCRWDR